MMLGVLDEKLMALEQEVAYMEKRNMDDVTAKISKVESKFPSLDHNMDAINGDVDILRRKLLGLADDFSHEKEWIETEWTQGIKKLEEVKTPPKQGIRNIEYVQKSFQKDTIIPSSPYMKKLQKKKEDNRYVFPEPIFNISRYVNYPPDFILNEYIRFHNSMVRGEIPPRFLIFTELNDGSGFGNNVESLSFAFLFAFLTGRALLVEFSAAYPVTNAFFDPPGFDWSYHLHPAPIHYQNFLDFNVVRCKFYICGN